MRSTVTSLERGSVGNTRRGAPHWAARSRDAHDAGKRRGKPRRRISGKEPRAGQRPPTSTEVRWLRIAEGRSFAAGQQERRKRTSDKDDGGPKKMQTAHLRTLEPPRPKHIPSTCDVTAQELRAEGNENEFREEVTHEGRLRSRPDFACEREASSVFKKLDSESAERTVTAGEKNPAAPQPANMIEKNRAGLPGGQRADCSRVAVAVSGLQSVPSHAV